MFFFCDKGTHSFCFAFFEGGFRDFYSMRECADRETGHDTTAFARETYLTNGGWSRGYELFFRGVGAARQGQG